MRDMNLAGLARVSVYIYTGVTLCLMLLDIAHARGRNRAEMGTARRYLLCRPAMQLTRRV